MDKRTWKVFVAFMLLTAICVGLSSAATRDGEISVQIRPDHLVSGQIASHTIIVKNTCANDTRYELEAYEIKGSAAYEFVETTFWIDAGDTITFLYNEAVRNDPGEVVYKYVLDWDRTWPTSNVLLDTVVEERRCFSVEEVSDNDHDNLMHYVEVEELDTNPNDPDTDGDGKRDDVDERPTTPEGSISITLSLIHI